jgi:hypothetical protein
MFSIKRHGGAVCFCNFKKNRALSALTQRRQQSGPDTAPPKGGIDSNVEDFGLVGRTLPPRTESRWLPGHGGQQQRVSGIVAQRPLGSFRATILDARNRFVVCFRRGSHDDRTRHLGRALIAGARRLGAAGKRLHYRTAADGNTCPDERLQEIVQHGVEYLLGHRLFARQAERRR